MSKNRILAAVYFADGAHLCQLRKSGEPFLSHPLHVAILAAAFGGSEDDVIAALLHDTLEDNPNILQSHLAAWGHPVVQRVAALTKNYAITRDQRIFDLHGRLLQAIATMGVGVAAIKLADRAHNTATFQSLSADKRKELMEENNNIYAPLARQLGAHGLADFLDAGPTVWQRAAIDFIGAMTAAQPAFMH